MQLLQMQKPRRRSDWTDLFLESAHFQLSFAIGQSEVRKKAARSKNRTCKLKGTKGLAYDHALTSKFTKKTNFLQNSANIKIHRVKILQNVVFLEIFLQMHLQNCQGCHGVFRLADSMRECLSVNIPI